MKITFNLFKTAQIIVSMKLFFFNLFYLFTLHEMLIRFACQCLVLFTGFLFVLGSAVLLGLRWEGRCLMYLAGIPPGIVKKSCWRPLFGLCYVTEVSRFYQCYSGLIIKNDNCKSPKFV